MASWDTPSVAPPGAMSYAAGLTDFSNIGNLANDYYKGAENKRQYDLARTFSGGLPRDAAGNIDFNRAAEMLAVKGDASQLVPLSNVDMQRRFLGKLSSDSNSLFPTGQPGPGAAAPQGSYSTQTASVESGGDPTAKNPNSSASGPYQFTNGTWLENFDKTFPNAAGLTSEQKLAVRDNPAHRAAQDKVFQTFTAGNESALRDAGIPVNNTTRYAAHFFGAGDASKVLTAPANAPLAGLVSQQSIDANPFLRGMTAGQARNWLATKMPDSGGGATASAAPARPTIPPSGVPKGSPDGVAPDQQPGLPVRVAGPGAPTGAPQAAAAPQAAPPPQAAPVAAAPPTAPAPQPAPAATPMPPALRAIIPPQFNDPMQYVNALRQKQAEYEQAGLLGLKGADGAAKAYGAQADKVMDQIGKFYDLTPEQKNAAASGGLTPLELKNREQEGRVAAENRALTGEQKNAAASGQASPLQFENAKIVAKVAAENDAHTPETKLYERAVKQGFQGTEMQYHVARTLLSEGQTPGGAAGLTGEAFLQTLEQGRANQIKAIADGRMAPPGGMSLKSPQIQALMRDVAQYEPGFDLTAWKARNDTRADLAKGKMGQNVSSFNTAIGHLDTLDKAAEGLNNYSLTPINSVLNVIKSKSGDPAITKFETARTAVADELTRAFRGTGGNVHDLVQWEKAINAAGSPAQLKAAIAQAVDLLRSRIEAVGDQYNRGMGKTTDPLMLLSPKARAGIQRLSGEAPSDPAGESAVAPSEGATATNPQTGQKISRRAGKGGPAP